MRLAEQKVGRSLGRRRNDLHFADWAARGARLQQSIVFAVSFWRIILDDCIPKFIPFFAVRLAAILFKEYDVDYIREFATRRYAGYDIHRNESEVAAKFIMSLC